MGVGLAKQVIVWYIVRSWDIYSVQFPVLPTEVCVSFSASVNVDDNICIDAAKCLTDTSLKRHRSKYGDPNVDPSRGLNFTQKYDGYMWRPVIMIMLKSRLFKTSHVTSYNDNVRVTLEYCLLALL